MERGWQVASVAFLIIVGWFGYESFQLFLSDAIGPGPASAVKPAHAIHTINSAGAPALCAR